MTTAVDTSVLMDMLADDDRYAEGSVQALRRARSKGRMIICECVLAEVRPALSSDSELTELLDDLAIMLIPGDTESALLAGRHYARYLARGGTRVRVVPDFLIGAHAQVHADQLLARDRGYLRDYFADLQVIDPAGATNGRDWRQVTP
jgi:predicted nucleic acid-binding protein